MLHLRDEHRWQHGTRAQCTYVTRFTTLHRTCCRPGETVAPERGGVLTRCLAERVPDTIMIQSCNRSPTSNASLGGGQEQFSYVHTDP